MDKKKIVFIAVPDEGKDDALVSRARNITAKLYLEINNLPLRMWHLCQRLIIR